MKGEGHVFLCSHFPYFVFVVGHDPSHLAAWHPYSGDDISESRRGEEVLFNENLDCGLHNSQKEAVHAIDDVEANRIEIRQFQKRGPS